MGVGKLTDQSSINKAEPWVIADKMLTSDKQLNLCRDFHLATLRDTKEIFWYDHLAGIYKPNGEVLIEEYCKKEIPSCSTHFRNEVINHIKILTYRDRSVFDSNPTHIVLLNGVFDLQSDQLLEHSAEDPKRIQLPVTYDATARCPNFLKSLLEILPDQQERTVVLEEMASILLRTSAFQKAYMWVGEGSNGKSTLHKVIHALLGKENVSEISIHSLVTNRFAPAQLDGKLANIFSDISNTELTQTGMFKTLVSGDPIDVERKNKNFYRMESFCKMFYSCNQFPEVFDQTDAFFRRWVLTEFTEKFEEKNDNRNLINELTTPEELSGILNLLIPIARALKDRGYNFSKSATTEQVRREWGERADPVNAFARDCLIVDVTGHAPKHETYNAYIKWCKGKNFIPKGIQKFNAKLQANLKVVEDTIKIEAKATKVWKGVRMNSSVTKVTKVTTLLSHNQKNSNKSGIRVTEPVTSVTSVTNTNEGLDSEIGTRDT
ncbi:MAG: putative DNA primase/helicase [Candidatus Nitrosomirales archaeon]|jgi:putative DNA primase/helicase